jgi:hypothetical protein
MTARTPWLQLAAALSVGLLACAGPPPAGPSEPWSLAVERSRGALQAARANALEVSDEQAVLTFTARHNPAACECPPWEIVYRGRWTRVFLELPPQRADLLAQALAEPAAEPAAEPPAEDLRLWAVTGRLAGSWRLDAVTGLRYPVFTVEQIAPRQGGEDRARSEAPAYPPR